MYLIVTRSFPPEIGGMQNLMWGLTYSLAKYDLVKVFADHHDNYKDCLLYTSPSPRDVEESRMPSSA